jgi:sarcosine oxidase / L-pipecolate oxidase
MSSKPVYDVIVIGGGAVGLATVYEVAKAGSTVILLQQTLSSTKQDAQES